MGRSLARGAFILVAVVVCPLLAWDLAVGATNRGYGATGFFVLLLGIPLAGALLAAVVLRRRPREATFGAVGAVVATIVFVVALVFLWLSR
jgi:hypothetical protein